MNEVGSFAVSLELEASGEVVPATVANHL